MHKKTPLVVLSPSQRSDNTSVCALSRSLTLLQTSSSSFLKKKKKITNAVKDCLHYG